MFNKLRRRCRPADTGPARPPVPATPPRPEPPVADAQTLARAERLRTALHQAGLDLARLGPEPSWLSEVRTGQTVSLGPHERTELVAYTGVVSAATLASDDACAAALRQIEAIPLLREMRDEGMTIHTCGKRLSAQSLRTIQKAAQRAVREDQEQQAAAVTG
ncbi:hypothetical protein [Streptomyces sp. bgisy060]|uniref:hypothetical protein n=1 Tax=Streptomyces sp. bgisy060 TaxID=3413775 RepID=UPI003EBD490D